MTLITRYLVSEILKTTFGVLLILLLIGLSNEFVNYLSKAAAGEPEAGAGEPKAGETIPRNR